MSPGPEVDDKRDELSCSSEASGESSPETVSFRSSSESVRKGGTGTISLTWFFRRVLLVTVCRRRSVESLMLLCGQRVVLIAWKHVEKYKGCSR